jgi:SOS response regulatory protein OraA/RecX
MNTKRKQLKMANIIDARMKQTAVIEFLTTKGFSSTEMHGCLNSVYGEHIWREYGLTLGQAH